MAVYEQTYKRYAGPLTPEWSRFFIIPRHAFRDVFKSKLFTAFFVICFLPLLVEAILIYLHHNAEALGILKAQATQLILISLMTWIPGLLLFFFQASLEGFSWFGQNFWIASAIFLSSLMWILVLALLSQTISAWVKWRLAASAALVALYLIPTVFAEVVNQIFTTTWGHIISVDWLRRAVTAGLFGTC